MSKCVGKLNASNDLFPPQVCVVNVLFGMEYASGGHEVKCNEIECTRLRKERAFATSLDHDICHQRSTVTTRAKATQIAHGIGFKHLVHFAIWLPCED